MIAMKLVVIATSSLGGWLCMLLSATVYTLLRGNWAEWSQIAGGIPAAIEGLPWIWRIAILSNLVLGFVSTSAMLLAFTMWLPAHHRKASVAFLLLNLQAWLLVWDAKHDWNYRALWTVYAYGVSGAVVVVSILLLSKAVRSRSLSPAFLAAGLAVWFVYVASTIATYGKVGPHLPISVPLPVVALAGSGMLLPLASIALAPLALAWWRHR